MNGKQLVFALATGAMLLNPIGITVLASENLPAPRHSEIDSESLISVGETATEINKPTQLVVNEGRFSLTKNPESIGKVDLEEATASLDSIDGLLEESDSVVVTNDADTAIQTEINGGIVEIPRESDAPIVMNNSGVSLEITLPKTEQTSLAQPVANGVVAYATQSDFANAVQATNDGGVRMTTIIDNPKAPTEYEYQIRVEGGYVLTEATNENGEKGVIVLNEDQSEIISIINTPWAQDANGKEVVTWFEIRGNRLIQHVEHNAPGVVYPVTADPYVQHFWWGKKAYFSRGETLQIIRSQFNRSAWIAFVPHWYASAVAAFLFARGHIIQGYYNRGNCVAVQYTGGISVWYWEYSGSSCK